MSIEAMKQDVVNDLNEKRSKQCEQVVKDIVMNIISTQNKIKVLKEDLVLLKKTLADMKMPEIVKLEE